MMKIRAIFILIIVIISLNCENAYSSLQVNSLTSGSSTTDAISYNTASVSPSANALIILVCQIRNASTPTPPTTPTISGNGLTWVLVNTTTSTSLARRKLTMFRAMGNAPTTGAITITGGETLTHCIWSVFEITGADTSGSNGSGAVIQNIANGDPASGTSGTLTLSTFGSTSNIAVGAFAHFANEATTPGSGFTEIHDISFSESATGFETEYKLNSETVNASWATSIDWLGIAIEVKSNQKSTLYKSTIYNSTLN